MIVPDFGAGAEDKEMVALKKAIETAGGYAVKVVDLPAVVRVEHVGEELTDTKVIELSARKLEQLATCDDLIWDGTNSVELRNSSSRDEEKFYLCREGDELFVVDENDIDFYLEEYGYPLEDEVEDEVIDYDRGAPNIIVAFGKSAMLTGGLGRKDLLFINPEYESEWPWKKQYYADQELSGQYHCDKYAFEHDLMESVIWVGVGCPRPWRYSRRYGLITDADYIGEFWDRYPCMAEVARMLDGDIGGLAKFICEFADDKLTFPLEEVYEAIRNLPGRGISNLNIICDFIEPVKLDGFTVHGLRFGAPMSNGQSCNKLKVAECDHTLPLERIQTRRELNLLRDAIIHAGLR